MDVDPFCECKPYIHVKTFWGLVFQPSSYTYLSYFLGNENHPNASQGHNMLGKAHIGFGNCVRFPECKKTSLRFTPWDRFACLLEYRLRCLSASKENILKEGWRSSKSEQAYPEKPAANCLRSLSSLHSIYKTLQANGSVAAWM